ncbi:MAG: ABC transporter permease [Acidobacteriia bacterium]|nr:ABC transporter permease [Terriglobia bacterium]
MRLEHWWYTVPLRLRSLFRRRQVEQELDDELHYHIELKTEEYLSRGMSAEEARHAAMRAMGGVEQRKEECRDTRRVRYLEELILDFRYAGRSLRHSPSFALTTILTLAVGVIGTTLVITAYNALALRSLPVKDPNGLVVLKREARKGGTGTAFSNAEFRHLSEHNAVFEGVVAEAEYSTVLAQLPDLDRARHGEPRQILTKLVSENYFSVLGIEAIAGRTFTPQESPGGNPVAVLSFSSWQRRFQADPGVLGQTVLLYGTHVTIIGIAPADFVGTGLPPVPPDLWVPLRMEAMVEPGRDRAAHSEEPRFRLVGRLKPGIRPQRAQAGLTVLVQQLETRERLEPLTAAVKGDPPAYFIEPNNPQFRALSLLLMGCFSMVLLIACANLANLFLARSAARRKELAVRAALGASRGRLVRQLLTEGVLLGLAAGSLALMVSPWLCDFIWMEIQERIIFRFTDLYVFTFRFTPDLRVLAGTFAVSVVAGVLFSVMAAVASSRVDFRDALQDHVAQWTTNRRWLRVSGRDALITAQVLFSLVLLVNAGLLARGMVRGQAALPGLETHHVVDIEFSGIENLGFDGEHAAALREQLAEKLSALPAVTGVAFADHVPLLGAGTNTISVAEGSTERAFDNHISPGFLSVFGIDLVQGRDFTAADLARHMSVLIITESTARHLWPDENPLGKIVLVGKTRAPMEVIGVARDACTVALGRVEPFYLYLPAAPDAPLADVFVRTRGEATSSIPLILGTAASIDKNLTSLASVHSMDDALWFQRLPSKIATLFALCVGSLAMFLASVGIYGTIAYAVTQRTREVGIRIALGATPISVLGLILGRIMKLVGFATGIGLAAAALVSHVLTTLPFGLSSVLLFGISPKDPLAFAAIAFFLALMALSAGYLPARRATRINPMEALRYE